MKHIVLIILLVSSCLSFSQKKKKHGPFEDYYKSGELKTSGQYRDGLKMGQWKDYYKSGELSKIYLYNNKGEISGIQESYFKNGDLRNKTSSLKTGGFIKKGYYEEGTLSYEMLLSKSPKSTFLEKSGFYREYFKNKNIKVEANYKNNQLMGNWISYFATGEKEWEVGYYLDYKQGEYKKYFKNDQIELVGSTVLGLQQGVEKRYSEEGLLTLEGMYNKGKLDENWIIFDESGNKKSTVKFKKGVPKKTKYDILITPTKIPEGVFERVPEYPGCELLPSNLLKRDCMSKKVGEFVNKNYNTNITTNLGLEGRQKIFIIFKIDKTGNATDIRARASHHKLEEEAINVISKLPKMKPGIQRGKAVTVPYSLPIVFMVKGKTNTFNKGIRN